MLSLKCIRLTTCVEEENKETEGTTSYQMIQPQSRETSETIATSEEEPSQLQMTS